MNAIKAAIAYFASVFAIGFALGAVRTSLLVPNVGEMLAVSVELPIMLLASWRLCRWAVWQFSVEWSVVPRLIVASIAFSLLMGAEFALSTLVFRRAADEFFSGIATAAGMLGLAGQILFALFPVVQLFVPPRKN